MSAAPSFRTYLINLDRSPDRLAEIGPRLQALGLEVERVPGVDGVKLSDDEFARQTRENRYYKALRRGEVGCSLGHLEVMRRFVDSGAAYALVLEDDALFAPEFIAVLDAALKLRDSARDPLLQWDVLKLNRKRRRWIELAQLDATHWLVEYGLSVPSTTTAAMWTRAGAQRWIEGFHGVARPVDCELQFPWEHGLKIRSVHPPIADARDVESSLGAAQFVAKSPWPKAKYELSRLWPKLHQFGAQYGWLFIAGWLWSKRLAYRAPR